MKLTHKKRLKYPRGFIQDVLSVAPLLIDDEVVAEEFLDQIFSLERQHRVRSMTAEQERERKQSSDSESERAVSDGDLTNFTNFSGKVRYDWITEYEDSVSALVRDQLDQDPEVAEFRTWALPHGILKDVPAYHNWVKSRIPKRRGRSPKDCGPDRTLYLFQYTKVGSAESHSLALPLPSPPCPILEQLKRLSVRLSKSLNLPESHISLMICTGYTASIPSYVVDRREDQHACLSRILLEIDPVLTPEQVATLYQRERQRMRADRRQPHERHLSLLRHCLGPVSEPRSVSVAEVLQTYLAEQEGQPPKPKSSRPKKRVPRLLWKFEDWNERWNPIGSSKKDWAYLPEKMYVETPKETQEWYAEMQAQLNPHVKDPFIPKFEMNYDEKSEERERTLRNACFANFRRDLSRIKRRLWGPYPDSSDTTRDDASELDLEEVNND